ncbi:MAG: branched-chain amino acid ABC transporter permease [Salinirussus sp.]
MASGAPLPSILSTARRRSAEILLLLVAIVFIADLARRLAIGTLGWARVIGFIWDGTVLGLSVGLAGIGLALTYSILRFANFAHGDLVTAGAFAGWITTFLIAGLGSVAVEALIYVGGPIPIDTGALGVSVTNTPIPIVAGLIVSAVTTAALALGIDRLVFRPIRNESGISLLIASVGVALALRYTIVFFFQAGTRGLTSGSATPDFVLTIDGGSVTVTAHEVTLAVVAALLMLGTHLLLQRTKLGTAMRAMADNRDLAQVTGIPTERVVRDTWLLGGGLAGASGFLIALEQGTLTTDLGWALLLLIFAAVILGGIGSAYGAILGGLLIGISSRLSLVWIPSSLIIAAAFVAMIAVMLIKPAGLLGGVRTA